MRRMVRRSGVSDGASGVWCGVCAHGIDSDYNDRRRRDASGGAAMPLRSEGARGAEDRWDRPLLGRAAVEPLEQQTRCCAADLGRLAVDHADRAADRFEQRVAVEGDDRHIGTRAHRLEHARQDLVRPGDQRRRRIGEAQQLLGALASVLRVEGAVGDRGLEARGSSRTPRAPPRRRGRAAACAVRRRGRCAGGRDRRASRTRRRRRRRGRTAPRSDRSAARPRGRSARSGRAAARARRGSPRGSRRRARAAARRRCAGGTGAGGRDRGRSGPRSWSAASSSRARAARSRRPARSRRTASSRCRER